MTADSEAGPRPTSPQRLRIACLADSDSYVKWGAALLGSAVSSVDPLLLVVDSPAVVSDKQLDSALAGSGLDAAAVRRIDPGEIGHELAGFAPDAVLLASRGPLVRVLARLVAGLTPRPVIVSGLPGISIPATSLALIFRAQCDLFVLHSRRELRDFAALARARGLEHRFALSRLPFAHRVTERDSSATDLVFAAQALVPREHADRVRVAQLLIAAAEADPSRRVVLKLRGLAGESQTHAEIDGYPEILAELARSSPLPANLVVSTGPMTSALNAAEGLVTVSSTAAIEAVARGIPVIALDTFGVTDELINPVFIDSGLLAGEAAAIARDYRTPRESWLSDNYFHSDDEDDWLIRVGELVELRRRGALSAKPALARRGGRARDAFERKLALGRFDRTRSGSAAIVVGLPVRFALRAARRTLNTARPA